MDITIYTDGASRGNPGPGGYGVVLMAGPHRKEISEGFALTTNNRMELLAVIVGLEALKFSGSNVTIYSDSQYVVNSVEKGWVFSWVKKGFKGKKNSDLWKRFLEIYSRHNVKFVWIKGHNDTKENERCDRLAVAAALDKKNLKDDVGFLESQNEDEDLFNAINA
ncbi:MAG: ribonuclease HI [Bacteroidales bacterium]|jgi:ribonuclease HI|nr:ribonuclease HI [Bacteroidales bacterium]MBQ5404234.1 ribonuclease HI [Bacteroidales bacterium]MBR6277624.1 ribonuclease HI [Bacteroidales bacterium]